MSLRAPDGGPEAIHDLTGVAGNISFDPEILQKVSATFVPRRNSFKINIALHSGPLKPSQIVPFKPDRC